MAALGEIIPGMLVERGVETVFGIPGVHTVEMYRGLPGSGLTHITPRHEQGAGFMADGYYRATGRIAACFIITGPGMTNIITAMAQAYGDSIPMLVISSVNAEADIGKGGGALHELPNQLSLTAGVTAFSRQISDAAELGAALDDAFDIFHSARPRPVHIQIPIDRLSIEAGAIPAPRSRPKPPAASEAMLAEAARLLNGAKRPLLILGGGAVRAAAEARQLAEALGAPVLMSNNARGILPADHPLNAGGALFHPAQRRLISESDVALAIGAEFGPTDWGWDENPPLEPGGALIRVDVDGAQLKRGPAPGLGIVAESAGFIGALLPLINRTPAEAPDLSDCHAAPGAEFYPRITRHIPLLNQVWAEIPEALIVGDSAEPVYAGMVGARPPAPRHWFSSATGYGTLGYGLPAAIGASLAKPDAPVIALAGDGGVLFSIAELAAAVEAKRPVILLIWNNEGYGEIRNFMTDRQITPEGVALSTVDFASLAKGFGAGYQRVKDAAEVISAIREASAGEKPVILEMREGEFRFRGSQARR